MSNKKEYAVKESKEDKIWLKIIKQYDSLTKSLTKYIHHNQKPRLELNSINESRFRDLIGEVKIPTQKKKEIRAHKLNTSEEKLLRS